ncbi:hypothetical protein PRZ48_002286 [Zasmidium cellare]|uniref:Dynactin subunit 4 n=1 Tax=Zasmidium cellare TaxID=395010 RepID=A0ABR0F3T4_ZASCE|nr:hypothetical protein PRZ48_002286 [Zasmidium cellare]
MTTAFPYVRYACPCTETAAPPLLGKRSSQDVETEQDEGLTFNPHDQRANFSLYPLDQLLFCDECNHTRCPKCWTDEMIYWYCPHCQFDVPSSSVKSDGNSRPSSSSTHLRPDGGSSSNDSYILHCQYCDWSTLEIDVKFSKPSRITEQLQKAWKARYGAKEEKDEEDRKQHESPGTQHDATFANLQRFYKDQLSESGDQPNMYSNSPYSSPANLARIMNLYGGLSYNALKKTREKPQPMREAGGLPEGLVTYTEDGIPGEEEMIEKIKTLGLEGTASEEQRLTTPQNYDTRFQDELWPIATPLRVRRGKRCRTCRQFLARPEHKVGSMRYKIRLLALNYVQRLSISPLQPTAPRQNPSFQLRPETLPEVKVHPHQTQQYILTVRNPIFETVKVTLATPATTPGKVASKVTILCPSFTVGPAGDMWDEALSASTTSDGSRRAAMASLTGSSADGDRQPEAGKVWERSRNTTSVILEVVPGAVKSPPKIVPDDKQEEELTEDDDILEIPIYVRAEWEAVPHDAAGHADHKGERESREFAYWCVLGVARITQT